jgi:hypothetical protein
MGMRYGGVAPGTRPYSQTFVLSPAASNGVLLNQTFDDAAQSIRIDNLSFVWLYVEPLQRFVPPLRVGWRANITPSTATVTISQVDSPTGQNPVDTGNEQTINVEISNELTSDSEGADTTFTSTGTANIATALEVNNQAFTSDASADTTLEEDASIDVGVGIGLRLRIIQMRIISLAGSIPTMWVEVNRSSGGDEPFAYLGVSASMPTDWIILPDNGIYLPYDAGIPGCELFIRQRSSVGGKQFRMLFGYHSVVSA